MSARLRTLLERSERGSMTIEIIAWAPVLALIIGLMILGGRMTLANGSVDQAANAAARAASLARTAEEAQASAQSAAETTLTNAELPCISTAVEVDTADLALPVGTTGTVSVTITCEVYLADLGMPGVPGVYTMTGTGESVLDTYRVRG